MHSHTPNHSILILDDHPIVAQGIRDIVSALPGVASAEVISNNIDSAKAFLYIVDLELGQGNGFDVIYRLRKADPTCHILVYTMHDEPWIKANLHRHAVDGAVAKSEPISMLREAVAAIINGKKYFSPAFAYNLVDVMESQISGTISERERQVLKALYEGDTSDEISKRMGLSLNTIQTYRRRLLEKFNVSNTAQLIYVTKGLIR